MAITEINVVVMTSLTCDYAKLIQAAGAKDPVSAILRCLTDSGGSWGALLTASGKHVNSVTRDSFDEVDAKTLSAAFDALPRPVARTAGVRLPDGREVLAFPVRAESRLTAVLLMAVDGAPEAELARFGESAALLLRLQWRYRRRLLTAARVVRDSVVRLMFAGRLDSAFELAAEMGLAAPPTRLHVVCFCGLADWDSDDVLDLVEAGLPGDGQQILAYSDEDECWMLLTAAQFQALKPELVALPDRDPALKVLLTENVPATTLHHRWQHWATDIRNRAPGTCVEAAADSLGVHRNTLRYRVRTAEKLLGVDLTDPTPASELWLALRNEGLVPG